MNELKKPIYLDYSATTPVDPRVAQKMIPFLTEEFGNPASGPREAAIDHVLECCEIMRQTGSDSKVRFEVVVWTADGPGGAPGSELAHYAAVADGCLLYTSPSPRD